MALNPEEAMKFGRDLVTSMAAEWEAQYCNYNMLKAVSYANCARLSSDARCK